MEDTTSSTSHGVSLRSSHVRSFKVNNDDDAAIIIRITTTTTPFLKSLKYQISVSFEQAFIRVYWLTGKRVFSYDIFPDFSSCRGYKRKPELRENSFSLIIDFS